MYEINVIIRVEVLNMMRLVELEIKKNSNII